MLCIIKYTAYFACANTVLLGNNSANEPTLCNKLRVKKATFSTYSEPQYGTESNSISIIVKNALVKYKMTIICYLVILTGI
jgi:hypothetical protein